MTIANWCVLIAALLPFVCTITAKSVGVGKSRRNGGYDNNDPRGWLSRQTGLSQRANSAQANSFEALPFFIGAVALAQQGGADQGYIDQLAMAFIGLRVVYIGLYFANLATLRSVVWFAAIVANVMILLALR
ncbi:MAG: MAPEG family protein [Aquabacterium sp.]|nr:MAPEG family protein [Aquabacterium sp.]